MDDDAAAFPLELFPLSTVLFPGGALPLQIFEVRYLDLIGRCHREGTPFGVVCLTRGSEVRQRVRDDAGPDGAAFASETFEQVGTLAEIVEFERPQAGLLRVRCRAGSRFRLLASALQPHGLWTGTALALPDDVPLTVPHDLAHLRSALQQVYARIEAEAGAEALPAAGPPRWDDCGWLANRWCELLPVDAAQKQQLLVLESPLLRLELVADLLERLSPGTAG